MVEMCNKYDIGNQHNYQHNTLFQLNDKTMDLPLIQLDLINITYYKSKTAYLDIYDTNFSYVSSILPLCTSILECPPKIINGKKITTPYGDAFYSGNTYSIFSKQSQQSQQSQQPHQYPSFYCDIEDLVNSVFAYKKILKKSLDYNIDKYTSHTSHVSYTSNCLIRFYALEPIQSYLPLHCYNERSHLSEHNVTVFIWEWEFIRFLIIVNVDKAIMTLHVNINITEHNTLISSKRDFINDKLKTIGKIIYYISSKVEK
jgi:hypothetical protein